MQTAFRETLATLCVSKGHMLATVSRGCNFLSRVLRISNSECLALGNTGMSPSLRLRGHLGRGKDKNIRALKTRTKRVHVPGMRQPLLLGFHNRLG